MTQLISRFVIFLCALFLVPPLVFANDISSSHQSRAMFHTLKVVTKKTNSLPSPMTSRQLAKVKGMISLCADCVTMADGNATKEILTTIQALVKQNLQEQPQQSQKFAQEAVVTAQTVMKQNFRKAKQQQNLAQEIITSTQARVNQKLQQVQQAQNLVQEVFTSTQALVNQAVANLPHVPRIN